jgi:CDP-diacylglycerol---serine O-phosphatidyltransferase
MSIKKNIPNLITCGNLLCGCLAIVSAFNGDLIWSAYFVGIAAVLDFLDGFIARMLKVHSEIGKQLDSLADMVTFGVVPGVIVFHLLNYSLFIEASLYLSDTFINAEIKPMSLEPSIYLKAIPYMGFLITVFSALRLAKFNIDTRQSDSFIGVPTPANTILFASLPLILDIEDYSVNEFVNLFKNIGDLLSVSTNAELMDRPDPIAPLILSPWVLISLTLLMSFLLVAELPLFALKFKHFKWKGNEIRYIFLALSAALLILFQFTGIPFIIFLYIVLSLINNIGKKKKEQDYDLIAKK